MKKFKKYLILIIFAAVLGFSFAFLKHEGYWLKLTIGLKLIKWYLYPLLIILIFFITILIHELGHLFSFLFNKIKIRALLVLIFVLKKDQNNKWKFEIYPKHIKLIGGIVVPNLDNITNEEEFNKVRKGFSKALIAGPNTSIGYLVLSIILFFFIWFLTSSFLLIGLLFVNLLVTIAMTILIVLSSKISTDEIFGDYVAYDKFKNDDKFALLQLIQYSSFSTISNEKTDKFLFDYLTRFYEKSDFSYHFFDLILASNFISFYLRQDNLENIAIYKLLKYYQINKLAVSKNGLELAYLISACYYKQKKAKEAYHSFNLIKIHQNRHIDKEKQELLYKNYEHLINLNNNELYFEEKRDLIIKDLFILAPIIDVDEMIGDMKFQLDFVEYFTKLYCLIDEQASN